MKQISYTKHFIFLSLLLIILFFVNISLGSVSIPFSEIFTTLTGGTPPKESWETIILNFRLPKAITAILVGSGLSICGLLMQTLFRNPLAGPWKPWSERWAAAGLWGCPINRSRQRDREVPGLRWYSGFTHLDFRRRSWGGWAVGQMVPKSSVQ